MKNEEGLRSSFKEIEQLSLVHHLGFHFYKTHYWLGMVMQAIGISETSPKDHPSRCNQQVCLLYHMYMEGAHLYKMATTPRGTCKILLSTATGILKTA